MMKHIQLLVCFSLFGIVFGCSSNNSDIVEVPELGILESGVFFEAHVPRRVKIENIWQGYVDGNLTRIYAGRLIPDYRISTSIEKDETQFGAVYVMIFLADGKVETHLYTTENETGALRIQEATEEYLIMDSIGTKELASQVYYYDLQAHKLVDSVVNNSK